MHLLKIKILSSGPDADYLSQYYQEKIKKIGYTGDCGIDLIFPRDIVFPVNCVTRCPLGIACEMGGGEAAGYSLEARSSISYTPLSLANSRGIIDPGYRGEIVAAFRCHPDVGVGDSYVAHRGERLVQIVANDMTKIVVEIVEELSQTDRGERGYGSTGK